MWPDMAVSISLVVAEGLSSSTVASVIATPGVQKPHCRPKLSLSACWTR